MARCGCNPVCTCRIEIEQTDPCLVMDIAGLGTPTNPYTVTADVIVDETDETLECGPSGLQARINTLDTDSVDIEGDGSGVDPITMEVIITPDNTGPLLGTPGGGINLLMDLGPGLYLSCEDVQDCVLSALDTVMGDCLEFDDDAGIVNVEISPEPNGIECDAGQGLAVYPSADANNNLIIGTDDRLFAPQNIPFQILDTQCINETVTGTGVPGDPQIISMVPIIDPNPCNIISCGPNGLLVPRTDFTAQVLLPGPAPGVGSPCFAIQETPGCPELQTISLAISGDNCNALECRADGLFVPFQRGESCSFDGQTTTPIPGGGPTPPALTAGNCVSFFTPTFNVCNSSCCDISGQFRIEFAGLNAFVNLNSIVRTTAITSFNGTPFGGVGITSSSPEYVEEINTTLTQAGNPGFKNFTIGGNDSFLNFVDAGTCFTVQFRMDVCVVQGSIRQFIAAQGTDGNSYQAIYQYAPHCDCACNGEQLSPFDCLA